MKPLPQSTKSRIISLLQAGQSVRHISRVTGASSSTIGRLRSTVPRLQQEGKNGRPRILSERQERFLVRMFATGNFLNAVEASRKLKNEYNIRVSAQTVRTTLKRNGMQSRIRRKKPLLLANHKKRRLQFARKTKNWGLQDWDNVVWSDESMFTVFGSGGRQYYWKRPGDPLQPHHVKPTVKHGGGSVMV